MQDLSIPVCIPSLVDGLEAKLPVTAIQDLPILLNTQDGWDWTLFAQEHGIDGLLERPTIKFDSDDSAISGALAGHGVALANQAFILDELSSGRLVAPFQVKPIQLGQYKLVYMPYLEGAKKIRSFSKWVLAKGRSTQHCH